MRLGDIAMLRSWCEAAPIELRRAVPELGMWLAWALCLGDKPDDAEEVALDTLDRVQSIMASAKSNGSPFNELSILTQLYLIRSVVARRTGSIDHARVFLTRARAVIPVDDVVLQSVLAIQDGLLWTRCGNHDTARRCFASAMTHAETAGHALLQVAALDNLAGLTLMNGDDLTAESLGQRASHIVQKTAHRGHLPLARFQIKTNVVSRAQPGDVSLTPREVDMVVGLRQGLSDAQLAAALGIAPSTVRWHCKNLYVKLGVHRRGQVTAQRL